MKKSVDIIGQSVVSITEGKECGHVKELLVNHATSSVVALVVDDRKWYKLLPFEAIAGLGEYAVTINNSADILSVADIPEFERLIETSVRVLGTKVITKSGKIQGKVNRLLIDNTGKINFCEMVTVNGEAINFSADHVITFGKEVVVIADEEVVTPIKPAAKTFNNSFGLSFAQFGGAMASTRVGMPAPQVVVSGLGPVVAVAQGAASAGQIKESNKRSVGIPAPQVAIPVAELPVENNKKSVDIPLPQVTVPAAEQPADSNKKTVDRSLSQAATEPPVEDDKKNIDTPTPRVSLPANGPAAGNDKKEDDLAAGRSFLLGRKIACRMETDEGALIIDRGDEITEEVLLRAKLAGKFRDLIKAPHLEGCLR